MAKEAKTRTKYKKSNDFFFCARHVKFSWGFIILAVAMAVLGSWITGQIPDATAQLFDGNFEMSRLWGVVGAALAAMAVTLVKTLFTTIASSRSTLAARSSAWEYMLNTGADYYDRHDPGELFSIVTVDCQTLGGGIVTLLTSIPSLVTLVLTSLVMMLGYSPKLLAALLVIITMHIVYMFFVGRWQQSIGKGLSTEVGHLSGYLTERIKNLMMIKTFGAEKLEDKNGLEASQGLYKTMRSYAWLSVIMGSFSTFSGAASTVITVLWGCYLLRTGQIDLPAFLGFTMYVTVINASFMFISIVWTFLKDFQGRAYRLANLIREPKENAKSAGGTSDIPVGDLTVENLGFTYPGAARATLTNISFTVPRGKITAVVGPSGSGKTTMVKLFERLYAPTSGRIAVNGTDIAGTDVIAWRNRIAYVVQDAGVFSGTIREALTYGCGRTVSDEELDRAVETVGLRTYLDSLPKGLDSDLAAFGTSLSGGQRQRIVIARAILKGAEILIFDEPTSALDPEAANAISGLILNNFKDKTVIIISHELNYIAAADNIVVINQGVLEAEGGHKALMERCDTYRELVEEQSYQEVFGS